VSKGIELAFNYFDWEGPAAKEKMKQLTVKEIANFFFDNETQAYRFSRALLLVKQKGALRLRDCPEDLPTATWKRYLDFGVQLGMLSNETGKYVMANRFTPALKNFADYYAKWEREGTGNEAVEEIFPNAKKEKEKSRRTSILK